MVILFQDDEMTVVANNGFVWIEYPDGSECVCSDDEADDWWQNTNPTIAGHPRPNRVCLDVVFLKHD